MKQKSVKFSTTEPLDSPTVPASPSRLLHTSKSSSVYNLHFRYIDRHVEPVLPIPLNQIYQDLSCRIPSKNVDLSGWSFLHKESKAIILSTLSTDCKEHLETLSLDFCLGINPNEDFSIFRSKFKKLKKLSIAAVAQSFQLKSPSTPFGPDAAVVICSFRSLVSLNMSDNIFTDAKIIFVSISESLLNLKTLKLARCEGITDPCLRALGQCIQRYRKLSKIDLSYCAGDFGDDGLVDLILAVN